LTKTSFVPITWLETPLIISHHSDHFPVSASIHISHINPVQPILKRSFKNVDFDLLNKNLKKIILSTNNDVSTDALLQDWITKFYSLVDEVAPLKLYPMRRQPRHRSPWLNNDIRDLMIHRDNVVKLIKRDNCNLPPYLKT